MSGSAGNLPIRITVDGAPQAEAAFNSIAATGERAMQRVSQGSQSASGGVGNLRTIVGQAGFQVQDFAVQVQGGTSALTALSQQGSQLLGVFGPSGAIAGAILTVGLLAAGFLDLSSKVESVADAERNLQTAIQASNEVYETAIGKADRLAQARLAAARIGIEERITAEREALRALNAGATDLEERRAFATGRIGGGGTNENPVVRAERERIAQLSEQISGRIAALELERTRLAAVTSGGEQYGPGEDENKERERLAAREARSSARANRPGTGNQTFDVNAAIERSPVIAAQRALNEYNQEVNLMNAGLERTGPVLDTYNRNMERLTEALKQGVITEEEFARNVETSSVALTQQIATAEQRGQRTSDIGRQLGLTFTSAFEDAISKGKDFGTVLTSLGEDLAKLIIRFTVLEPLARSVQGLFSGSGSSDGSGGGGFLSTIGSALGSYFGGGATPVAGARANGGPVAGGSSYLVGERGPEIVNFSASGTVTPNHAMGGVTFSPNYSIDARGADASILPRVEAIARAVAAQSLQQFTDNIRRGGPAARLVGR